MQELQVHMVLILIIACHTHDRRPPAQGRLVHLRIHQHYRVQREMLLVEDEPVRYACEFEYQVHPVRLRCQHSPVSQPPSLPVSLSPCLPVSLSPYHKQPDVLPGKQVKTRGRGLVRLTAIIEDGVQSETVLQRQFRIVPRPDQRQHPVSLSPCLPASLSPCLPVSLSHAHREILEIQAVHRKGKPRQVFHWRVEADAHLEAPAVHSDD